MSNEEILKAFHLMWDNFPEAVMITQRSREIVAVNKKAVEFGLQVGVKCSSIGKPENHKGCQCNAACDTGAAQFVTYDGAFGKAYGYWIPIPEKPEWIIHFGVGYAFEYPKISRGKAATKMESIHGLTKGTELEPIMAALAQGEANGVMMYYALARLAKEQGFDDAAEKFIEAANQEAVHAGFYAVLNGKYPKDFWQLVAGLKSAEVKGEASVKALADKVRAAGLTAAAYEMEIFAKQEGHHGVVLDELLKKYAPKASTTSAKKTFVCSICGYEHVGDAPPETCPICGQPADVFKEKSSPKASTTSAKKTFVCSVCGYEHVGDAPPEICPVCGQPADVFKEKSSPKTSTTSAKKTFVCSVCGYEHVVDAPPETCPVCGQPAEVFKEKSSPKTSTTSAKKTFVCSVCGYEHIGDAPPETCPVCGQPAEVFKEKSSPKTSTTSAPKTFVCSICGYEHVGDAPPETCPVCGQPSTAFKEKSAPKTSTTSAKKTFVCSICGYEHVGDAPPETCPVCGQPADVFKEKFKLKIQAVRFYDGGFMMKSFACGGGLPEGSIAEEKLRSSLQNYVIDTGDETILVDTGTPAEMDFPVTEKSVITFGDKIADYVDALKNLGYAPEKVSKILVTHKHPDHTGELRAFPNAKIFISRIEADDMNLTGDNVVRVDFTDGAYKNFPACQKIADGVYYIFAPGHTKGNSIVIVEDGEKFFMIHGDVTYTDEALIENKLSVVFEDLTAARDTLKRVREFIKANRTVYLSTHTPLGYENLAAQKIMTLPDV